MSKSCPRAQGSPQSSWLAFSHSDDSPIFLASAFFILAEVLKLPLGKQVSNLALISS